MRTTKILLLMGLAAVSGCGGKKKAADAAGSAAAGAAGEPDKMCVEKCVERNKMVAMEMEQIEADCAERCLLLEKARTTAFANENDPRGKDYKFAFSKYLYQQRPDMVSRCQQSDEIRERGVFDLLVQVASNGSLVNSLVEPENGGTECVRSQVPREGYPAPPAPDWWVRIGIRVRK